MSSVSQRRSNQEESRANSPQPQENPPGRNTRMEQPPFSVNEAEPTGGGNTRMLGLGGNIYPIASGRVSYEQKYTTDEFRQEMGCNGRVWRVYLDEAEINDRDMVQGWREGVDLLLVFAALFSGVVTTFVTQTSQKLDQDFAQTSASLLTELIAIQRATAVGSPVEDVPVSELNLSSPAQYKSTDIWINGLWFTSLILSLATALFAVLIKQWSQHYLSFVDGTPLDRARIHQFRYFGLQRWKVRTIIGVLPLLLYTALFLFFAGLFIFLQALKPEISYVVGAIGLITFLLYTISNSLPLLYPDCPYHTPLIEHIRSALSLGVHTIHLIKYLYNGETKKCPKYIRKSFKSSEKKAAKQEHDSIVPRILEWLWTETSNPSIQPIVLHSLSGLHPTVQYMKEVLGNDGSDGLLRSGLLHEFNRQWTISRQFYKNPESFIDSPDSRNVERIFRASLLLVADPCITKCIQWNFNDPKSFLGATKKFGASLLLWYIFVAHEIEPNEIEDTGIRPRRHRDKKFKLDMSTYVYDNQPIPPHISTQLKQSSAMSAELKPQLPFLDIQQEKRFLSLFPAKDDLNTHALNWTTWSNIYNTWQYHYELHLEDTPISKTYSWAGPFYQMLLVSRSNLDPTDTIEQWKTILPLLCHILPPSLAETSFGSSPLENFLASPGILPTADIKLRYILLSCVLTELNTADINNRRQLAQLQAIVNDACNGLEEAMWACQDTAAIAPLALVLDELVTSRLSFYAFLTGYWRWDVYTILCKAGFVAFMRAPPWPMASHRHFHVLLQNTVWMRHVWIEMFGKEQRTYLSSTASWIVDSLGGTSQGPEIQTIKNAFDAFMNLPLVLDYANEGINTDRLKQWPSHMQPIVRWMLNYLTEQSTPCALIDTDSPVHTFSMNLTEHEGFLTFICSSLLFNSDDPSNPQIVLCPETSITLCQLAEYHKDKPGADRAWNNLLTWVWERASRIRDNDTYRRDWTIVEFHDYNSMVYLVNDLLLRIPASGHSGTVRLTPFSRDEIIRHLQGKQEFYTHNIENNQTHYRKENLVFELNTFIIHTGATVNIEIEADTSVDLGAYVIHDGATLHIKNTSRLIYTGGHFTIHDGGFLDIDYGPRVIIECNSYTYNPEASPPPLRVHIGATLIAWKPSELLLVDSAAWHQRMSTWYDRERQGNGDGDGRN